MADGDTADTTTTPAPNGDGGTDRSFTQSDVERIVGERLARERGKYADYDDLKAKASQFDELQTSQQSDLERLTSERDTLKTQSETSTAENMRLRVALEKKLPAELIDRLQGSTKDELEADAEELLKLVKPASGFDGGARGDGTAPVDMNSMLRRAAGRT